MTQYKRKSDRVIAYQLPEWVRKLLKTKNINAQALFDGYYLVVEGQDPNVKVRMIEVNEFDREFEAMPEPDSAYRAV